MPFYAVGFLFLAIGMFLVWKEPVRALMIGDETSPDGAVSKLKAKLIGRIDLNGHYLEVYEEEDDQRGKRLRLRSFPPIGPESEAGFIRYLVREGFIEKRWPGPQRAYPRGDQLGVYVVNGTKEDEEDRSCYFAGTLKCRSRGTGTSRYPQRAYPD